MTVRTTEANVRKIIEVDESIEVLQFITYASLIVDRIASQVEADTNLSATASDLEMIEAYLAAHLYALRDHQYIQKQVGKSSGRFQGVTGMGLDLTYWGQMAKVADPTGYLTNGGRFQGGYWLGKEIND